MVKCSDCNERVRLDFPEIDWQHDSWLKVMNYFEHALNEEEMTSATWDSLTSAMMVLRPNDKDEYTDKEIRDKCSHKFDLDGLCTICSYHLDEEE